MLLAALSLFLLPLGGVIRRFPMRAGAMILAARRRIAHPRKELPLDVPGAQAPCETSRCTGATERNLNCVSEGWG